MKNINTFKSFESKESDELSINISDAISKVDDSLSYEDFAIAVANVIKEDYGSHNIEKFLEVLKKELDS